MAKELDLEIPKKVNKKSLIDLLSKTNNRKVRNTENIINNSNRRNLKSVDIFGKTVNRNFLIFLGIIASIYTIYSIWTMNNIDRQYYSNVSFLNDVSFKVLNTSKTDEPIFYRDYKQSPLCGCRKEVVHYGMAFFSKDYEVEFDIYPDEFLMYSKNTIIPAAFSSQEEINEYRKKEDEYNGVYNHFDLKLEYLKISKSDLYFNRNNFSDYINRISNDSLIKKKNIPVTNSIRVKKINSPFKIISLDDVSMSSIDIPFESEFHISKDKSTIQEKDLGYTIQNDFGNLPKDEYWTPELHVLGRKNAYLFDSIEITDVKNNVLFDETNTSQDSLVVIIAKSGFAQFLSPYSKNKTTSSLKLSISNPLSDIEYEEQTKKFESRRDGFYRSTTMPQKMTVEMNPPLTNNKPNGIHYYGKFSNLYSSETNGNIILEKITEKLSYPKEVNFQNVDSIKMFTQPLVFQSNPKYEFKNSFTTNGIISVNGEVLRLNTFTSLISFLFNILDSIISFIVAIIGLFNGWKGLTFRKNLKNDLQQHL
jgi:hypothetical protein